MSWHQQPQASAGFIQAPTLRAHHRRPNVSSLMHASNIELLVSHKCFCVYAEGSKLITAHACTHARMDRPHPHRSHSNFTSRWLPLAMPPWMPKWPCCSTASCGKTVTCTAVPVVAQASCTSSEATIVLRAVRARKVPCSQLTMPSSVCRQMCRAG